ncbi:glycine--tRNA ligase subunit beta [Buchnera aphidicola (Taiwanaphis decaspermi)]|uniref:glycine--tRNA ligase subunit beta n=1 Tax=Buchnera aphidicola TaxID=9 RepID=UPI0031B7EB63
MYDKILLIEINVEEIPFTKLFFIAKSFLKNIKIEIRKINFKYKKIKWFATSRRIAVQIFFKKEKVNYLNDKNLNEKDIFLNKLKNYLPRVVELSIKKIKDIKNMFWDKPYIKFIRPIRNIIILLDDLLIKKKIFNLKPNKILSGHRFMGEKKIEINHAKDYSLLLLKKGKVIADYNIRKNIIKNKVKKYAKKINGKIKITKNFLKEITSSVEWPNINIGKYDKKFLKIPKEIIIFVMKKQQKYFPVYDINKKKLIQYFIFVSNVKSNNNKQIISGHQNVLRSKLNDILFFIKLDLKKNLKFNLIKLKNVTFYKKLGNLYEKTIRIKKLSKYIHCLKNKTNNKNKMYDLNKASLLSKCDLVTNIVFEIPEMQGIIGSYYAKCYKEKNNVALAIKEHYEPRFAKDNIPKRYISCILSISDKIDTITAMFIINNIPNSKKDPFGLRRCSLGIIKIILKNNIKINIYKLIKKNISLYNNKIDKKKVLKKIFNFFYTRLNNFYENKGYKKNIIKSILSKKKNNLLTLNNLIKKLNKFYKTKKFNLVMKTDKRISNILLKNNIDYNVSKKIKKKLFSKKEEFIFFNMLIKIKKETCHCINKKKYSKYFKMLLNLHKMISIFFEKVNICDNNKKIMINRLTLLVHAKKIFSKLVNFNFFYCT